HREQPEVENTALYRGLLSLPALACVRALELDGAWLQRLDPCAAIPAETLAGLRSLALSCGPWMTVTIADFSPLERLQSLRMTGGWPAWGPLRLPALRSLELHVPFLDEKLVAAFAAPALDRLERLELSFSSAPMSDGWVDDYASLLRELLDAEALTGLRRLVLRVDDGRLDQRFAAMVLDAPLIRRLEDLDIAACPWDEAALAWVRERSAELPCQVQLKG
ncbi:MAG: hypothetical protein KC457_18535, partial [Myxococcales bacterium]|nr:hypothetical protein [Myxococcales bacterium]